MRPWLSRGGRHVLVLLWFWALVGALTGLGLAQDAVRIYWPTNGIIYLQPTNVPLTIQILVSVTSDFSASTYIYDGTNLLGSTSLRQHHLLSWSNVAFGEHSLWAFHQASIGPQTSSVARVRVEYGGWAMVPPGSVWAYRDGGVELGTDWRGTNADVSFWYQGPAKLGFGDDDVVTQLNWQNPTNGEVFPTYYFRHAFEAPNPSALSNLAARLRRDDGAIVYLNGTELFRDNMPEGEVNYLTRALAVVLDEYEFIQRWIDPTRLGTGTNLLAVEIHNANPQNHDVGFDLALVADIPLPPPCLAIRPSETNVLVSWPRGYDGFQVESASGLTRWERLTNRPATVEGRWVLTNRVQEPARFFRLRLE
jgi:hypothetical protein